MTKTVEFYFDFGSPASHLGYFEIKRICKQAGAKLELKPMLLGAVFQATGNETPVRVKAKGKWMLGDLAAYAERYGIPFKLNPYFILNTITLMRGTLVARERGELERYCDTMFLAVWRDGLNMADADVIAKVLSDAGFDVDAYLQGVQRQDIKDGLKAATEEAVERGVFGAPATFLDGKMYFGQDRLFWVEEALAA